MAELTFKIDFGSGFNKVPPPKNYKQTRLQRVWDNGMPSATLQGISYEWEGEVATLLNKYKADGLTGGTGILEGPGLQVYIGSLKIFDGCIDTANKGTLWECDRVKAPIIESGRIDWLKNITASVTFAHLKRIGIITTADYKKVPYHVTSIPDGPQLAMLMLQEIVMVHQLLKEINDLTNHSVEATGNAADNVAPYPGSAIGSTTSAIINTIAEIIYCGLLLVAIVKTAQLIFDQIIQKKKYKYAMRVEDLMKKACQYFTSKGYPVTFSSSIFQQGNYKDVTIMPRKIITPKSGQSILSLFDRDADETNSSLAYGHYDGTVKQLMDDLGFFNVAPVVNKGKLHLEEKNSYGGQSTWILPDTQEPGYTFNHPDPHKTNAGELAAVYSLFYATDQSDLNTIHQYRGTSYEVTMHPNSIHDSKNLLLKGLKKIDVPFAHAKRKEYLTGLEQFLDKLMNVINGAMNGLISIINGILNVINGLINIFGGNSTTIPTISYLPTNVMSQRIGWLDLSGDAFDVPKIFIGIQVGSEWHIHPNNATLMAAKTIVNTFHPLEMATRGGQQFIHGEENNTVKFKYCIEDDAQIADTNEFTLIDGKKGKFASLTWDPNTDTAEAIYRIREDWTKNLSETVSEDGE